MQRPQAPQAAKAPNGDSPSPWYTPLSVYPWRGQIAVCSLPSVRTWAPFPRGKGGSAGTGWWSNATSAVKRSIFIDNLVFSIATDRMKVQNMDRFGEDLADIALAP